MIRFTKRHFSAAGNALPGGGTVGDMRNWKIKQHIPGKLPRGFTDASFRGRKCSARWGNCRGYAELENKTAYPREVAQRIYGRIFSRPEMLCQVGEL